MSLLEMEASSLDRGVATPEICYKQYVEQGGIINELDYQSAISRVGQVKITDSIKAQFGTISRVSGIPLDNPQDPMADILNLYSVLRTNDVGWMSDQRLFREALKILNRPDLEAKVVAAHPNIFS